MGMKRERIKTIILAILVVLSIYLSLKIVNYQPEFKKMQKEKNIQENYIQNVVSGENLLSPVQMNIHSEGEHFGNSNEIQLKSVMEELSKWTISSLKDVSSNYSNINLSESIRDFKNIELVYADSVSFEVYKKYIKVSQKSNLNIHFDRVIIPFETGENFILFVSLDDKKVIEAKVNNEQNDELLHLVESLKETMDKVSPIVAASNKIIYTPSQEVKVIQKKYYRKVINQKKFEQALFSDSQNLRQSLAGTIETVSDGVSMMNVNLDSLTMSYVKPVLGIGDILDLTEKQSKSIDFVNSHAGWDERYRYVATSGFESTIKYRLFVDNCPVFNDKGMSEISVSPGKESVEMYNRPIFYLDFELYSPDLKEYTLRSGLEVLEQLKSLKDFQMDRLENLTVGYSMEEDEERNDVTNLVPDWYYKYNGVWNKIE
jgi:regulatory protein YycH of two-component signal transduction system YycFG